MEFLYKLYANEYFGIGLFIVISILAFSFLVILFFGKKDEKARNAMENQLEEQKEEKPVEESLETITLSEETNEESDKSEEENEAELETFKEKKIDEMDPFVTSNLVLNTDYINEELKEEPQEDSSADIYNLNSVMQENIDFASEDESIDDVLKKYDSMEEETSNADIFQEEPIIQEEIPESIFTEDNAKVASAPFSSVYLEKEEKKKEEKEAANTKPIFDLPKRNQSNENSNIISFMNDDK